MSAGPNYTRVVIVEGVRFCLNEFGQSTCPYDCGGEHPSDKLTDVVVESDGREHHRHVSKSEGGARRWAQRFARNHGLKVEVGE